MRPTFRTLTQALLGALVMAALVGCYHHDHDYSRGPVSSYYVNAIAVADLDANGFPDILGLVSLETDGVSQPSYVSTRLQSSAGSFQLPVRFGVGRGPANLLVADVNGDGRPDVAVACQGLPGDPGAVSVFLQSATTPGLLLPAVNYPGVSGPMGVAIADMDGDGHPDLILADGDIVVRFNNGAGTFGTPNFFYN